MAVVQDGRRKGDLELRRLWGGYGHVSSRFEGIEVFSRQTKLKETSGRPESDFEEGVSVCVRE